MTKKGSLSLNLLANVASFAMNLLVGIFFTPYLVRKLGIEAYGIIPLTTTICSYITVVTLVLNASVARFVTVALEQNKEEEANQYFNTSYFGGLVIAAVLLIPCSFLIYYSNYLFNIPNGIEADAKWLIAFSAAMILVSVVSTPFEVASFCKNRFDIRNSINIIGLLIRVGLVVLMFNVSIPSIFQVGVGIFLASIFSLLASISMWKKLTPILTIRYQDVSLRCLKHLTHSGGWLCISQLGTLLLLSIDLILVNRLFGASQGGKYATLLQWSILLRTLALTLAGVLSPSIISFYAKNEIEEMIKYSRSAVKYLGLFIALPIGLISGLSSPILQVWLGSDFVTLSPLLTLMTAPLCINLGYIPLHNISTATNNVKLPGIVQVVAGLCNLVLAIFLAEKFNWGMYGIAAAGIIVLTLRNVVFTPLYAARIIGKSYKTFLQELLPITTITSVLTYICWSVSNRVDLASLTKLMLFSSLISLSYFVIIWLFFLDSNEKKYLLLKIPISRYRSW